ncbi:hypothetical protein BDR04DRAFT_989526, partial [Suillus decipiens]
IQIIHTDVGGPITPKLCEGFCYWMVIQWKKDVQIFFHSEVHEECFSMLHSEFMHSDGGGEHTGN